MRKQNMISSPAPPSQPAQPRARHSLSGARYHHTHTHTHTHTLQLETRRNRASPAQFRPGAGGAFGAGQEFLLFRNRRGLYKSEFAGAAVPKPPEGSQKAISQPLLFHSPPGLAVPLLFHSQPGLAVWGSQPGLAPKQGEKLVQQPGLGVLAVAGGLRGGFGWTHMTAGPMLPRSESLEGQDAMRSCAEARRKRTRGAFCSPQPPR